jgi:gliding motility-associated-like protein
MKKLAFNLFFLMYSVSLFSQRGKDGAVTISATSTVNAYTSLSTNITANETTLAVQSASAFAAGDLIYIIQMQGASVNCYINIFGNVNSPEPYNSSFGEVTAYNNAGNNEYAQIASITGSIITVDCELKNNYTAAGKVQVIKVPRYQSLNITGTITCPPWNGTTGGVIAIEVQGNTTISSTGRIDASARGFRGGIVVGKSTGLMGGGSWGHNNQNEGGYKGESIAGDVSTYLANFNGPYAKGAVANGGGGGNANNCGGGGGANGGNTGSYTGTGNPDVSNANYITAWELEAAGFASSFSSGGGRGGYAFSDASLSPLTAAPGQTVWAGDSRRNQGGYGGRPLDYSSGKIFCGGGGGAGDENDTYGGAGGRGGGIIHMLSYGTVSGTGLILANGANGATTSTPSIVGISGRDGAGGGGGGGAIFINSAGSISSLTLSANGGNGGNAALRNNSGSTNTSYGPGGGGGGGYISTTAAVITSSVNGGANGIVTINGLNGSQIDDLFPPNGATRGGAGTVTSGLTPLVTLSTTSPGTICANNSTTVSATTTGTAPISWYTQTSGGLLLGTGSVFTTSVFTTPGTYTLFAGYCPGGTYRVPTIITVTNSPTVTVTSSSICSGQSTTLIASGASTYSWNTGSSSSSIVVTPASTTTYTVVGANNNCSASVTSTVSVDPGGALSVNNSTICSGQTATLNATGATTYTWSTGSNSASITVSPTANTIYTLNASSGVCQLTSTTQVIVNQNPTVMVNSPTVCSGQTATLVANGATTYSWSTGSTSNSITSNPNTSTIYTITGTTNSCTDVRTATVTIVPNPTVSVNSATICSGNSTTLTATGATSYSWNTGALSASIAIQPSITTVYTVTGTNANCSDARTTTITVIATPTLSVNSPSVCAGNSVTLTATGASTYSWSSGSTNASLTVQPSSSQTYTVTGSIGSCSSVLISTVTVNNPPQLTLNGTVFNLCAGETATITANSSSGTYTWSNGDNSATIQTGSAGNYTVNSSNLCGTTSSVVGVNVSSGPPSFTVVPSSTVLCAGQTLTLSTVGSTGTFSWNTGAISSTLVVNTPSLYIATLANGCGTVNSSIDLGSSSAPVVNITASSQTICAGGTVTLTGNATGDFLWSVNSQTTSAITVTTTGVFTLTVSNECGSTSDTYTVSNGPPPIITISGNGSFCTGQTATLTASGATSYSWNTGSSGSDLNVSSDGIYTATASNSCGTSSATYQVIFTSQPSVGISTSGYSLCPGLTATLTAAGQNGGNNYIWNDFPQNITNTQTVSAGGTYIVTYTNACGTSTAALTITQLTVQADFNISPADGIAPLSVVFTNNSMNNVVNQWNYGNGQTSTDISGQTVYNTPGTYTVNLLVQSNEGCVSILSKTIDVFPGEFGPIPEVITPNNDNYNDVFYINGIERYPNNELQIFNRWGNLVYAMKNYNNSWNGNTNVNNKTEGNKLPAGTYFILLELNDGSGKVYKSYCQLIY